jgi:predicted ester cyclase
MANTSVETNRAAIRRLVEAHNRRDAKAAAACFAATGTNHGRAAGPEGMEKIYRNLYATFPDYHWKVEALFGEDDWVALHVIQTGTHQGKPSLPVFGGLIHNVEPTGKPVSVPNIHLYEMKDGLIVRHVAVRDDLGMMQQLGLLPEVSHAAGDVSRPAR